MAESREVITTTLYREMQKKPKRTAKFGNRNRDYGDYRYDSGMEAQYAAFLDMCKLIVEPQQKVVRYDRQVKMELTAHGKHICNHYVDFRVWFADGHDVYHEVKGWPDKVYPIKRKLMLAQFPNICYKVFHLEGGDFIERKNFSRPR
jgi:hypothetical protein